MSLFDAKAIFAVQKIKNGGKAKLSVAQIAQLLINLFDAKKNLTATQFNDVHELYKLYQTYTDEEILDWDGYVYIVTKMIITFDALAPFEKFSGNKESETREMLDEIYSATGFPRPQHEEAAHKKSASPITERWYTCPDCGSLVREGETCDCAIQREKTMSKFCTNCGQENENWMKFCPACGAPCWEAPAPEAEEKRAAPLKQEPEVKAQAGETGPYAVPMKWHRFLAYIWLPLSGLYLLYLSGKLISDAVSDASTYQIKMSSYAPLFMIILIIAAAGALAATAAVLLAKKKWGGINALLAFRLFVTAAYIAYAIVMYSAGGDVFWYTIGAIGNLVLAYVERIYYRKRAPFFSGAPTVLRG